MNALKLYGTRAGRQSSYGAARGLTGPVSGRSIFVQNSSGTAHAGPGSVMWLGYYHSPFLHHPGGCFTNVSQALQNNITKIHNTKNHNYGENFKHKLRSCAQNIALGTRTKFQLEIRITSTISAIHKFRENTLESSRKVSETTPRTSCGRWFAG